jgi:hypothetical protein
MTLPKMAAIALILLSCVGLFALINGGMALTGNDPIVAVPDQSPPASPAGEQPDNTWRCPAGWTYREIGTEQRAETCYLNTQPTLVATLLPGSSTATHALDTAGGPNAPVFTCRAIPFWPASRCP